MENLTFDCVFSSDLPRAVQTARIVLPDMEPVQDPDLREVNVGVLTGRKLEECLQEYGEQITYSRKTRDFTHFGGEKSEDLRLRAQIAFSRGFPTWVQRLRHSPMRD